MLSGRILESEMRLNENTNISFCWARVSTCGVALDAVFDPECLSAYQCSLPVAGGIVAGRFWVSGRIVACSNDEA